MRSVMFIDFKEFVKQPEVVLERVLRFVGADPQQFSYKALPAGMVSI